MFNRNFIAGSALAIAIAGGGFAAPAVQAASVLAHENATIQPGGVRTGSSGLAFFNIEGSDNGSFASYGVARFDGAAIKASLDGQYGAGSWAIDGVSLELTQANAGFTTDGSVTVYYTADDVTSIIDGVSTLSYPVAGAFADAVALTTYNFTQVSSGTLESHALPDLGALWNDILAGDIITLLLIEADAGVAATYAGYTNTSFAGPTLVVDAAPVPLPAAALLFAGPLGLLLKRRAA